MKKYTYDNRLIFYILVIFNILGYFNNALAIKDISYAVVFKTMRIFKVSVFAS